MARHSHPGGRFDVTSYEQKSILDGIDSELRAPVGHHALWVEYAPDTTEVDRIYDVADHEEVGRQWKFPPIRIPAFSAFIFQGPTMHNDRGFYNADILRLSVAMNILEDIFPAWSGTRTPTSRTVCCTEARSSSPPGPTSEGCCGTPTRCSPSTPTSRTLRSTSTIRSSLRGPRGRSTHLSRTTRTYSVGTQLSRRLPVNAARPPSTVATESIPLRASPREGFAEGGAAAWTVQSMTFFVAPLSL